MNNRRAGAGALAIMLVLAASAAAKPRSSRSDADPPAAERDGDESSAEAHAAAPAPGGTTVKLSGEMSGYGDTDAVYVASPTVSVSVGDALAGWSVGARYLVDAVSAASVDIVSTASGKWQEYRHVGSANAELKTGAVGLAVSGGVSREPDYLSIGGGGTISIELLDKNFTPFVGGSYTHDDVGRTGEPHAFWRTMTATGGQAGATFVIDRATIGSLTFDGILERGYLAKPYRYIPLFAPRVAASLPAGASVDEVARMRLDFRPVDALPDARDRYAVTGRIAHRFDTTTLRIEERIYRDSWGLTASTTDLRVPIDLGARWEVTPHVRFHIQEGVDFWQRAYVGSTATGELSRPDFRTGDRELGPLGTLTVGTGLRWRMSAAGGPPWVLFVQGEGMLTRYTDALYITERRALITTIGLEIEID
jgi:hypothetical protein